MDWGSLFKIESIIKNLHLTGWFSNWNFLNRTNSPVNKQKFDIKIGAIIVNPELNSGLDKAAQIAKQLEDRPESFLPTILSEPLALPQASHSNQQINKRIDEAVAFINLGRMDEARTALLTILGEIKSQSQQFGYELGRIYNNLGVTYNQPRPDGDYDKALEYFSSAISHDPNSTKAKMNLSRVLINKGDNESVSKGLDQIKALWSVEKDVDVLTVLLLGLNKSTGDTDAVFKFLEEDSDAAKMAETKDTTNNLLAYLYLSRLDFSQAIKHADKALSMSPDQPEYMGIKAKALLIRAQEQHNVESEFDIVPKLDDFRDVNEALDLFNQAKDIAEQQKKSYLISEIEYGIYTCLVWLGRYDEAKHKLKTLQSTELDERVAHHIDVMNFAMDLENKDFEVAYNQLINGEKYPELSYRERKRIARIFLMNGAAEQAHLLLAQLEVEAEQQKDIYFWFDLSAAFVLLNKHQEAISAAIKVKRLADEQTDLDIKKAGYSHYNAIMFHFSKTDDGEDSETSRLLEGMQEFQKHFPSEQILVPIKAQEENGELSQEIKDILISGRDRFNNIKEIYKNHPIPVYHLEKALNKTFADLITYREDPDFTIPFTGTDEAFLKEITDNFAQAESLVFDYSSLLDLAKMDFLGLLEKLNKPIFIHELLFQKVQEELLQKEIPELRDLWNFLRKSKLVQFIRGQSKHELNADKIDDIFDEWLVETFKFAASKNSILVTNDLRTYAFSKSEAIRPINITVILKSWESTNLIDKKMAARALGDLAERYYTFLSYTGEDLFEIVLEDKGKITPRSYHLAREVFLPGSIPTSFIGVYAQFIDLFWRTGSLPEEKVNWLKLLTNILTEIIDKEYIKIKDLNPKDPIVLEGTENLKPIVTGLAVIWNLATKNGSKDDMEELVKIVDEVLNKEYLAYSKVAIKKRITDRITSAK